MSHSESSDKTKGDAKRKKHGKKVMGVYDEINLVPEDLIEEHGHIQRHAAKIVQKFVGNIGTNENK